MNKDETVSFDAEENPQSKESVAGKKLGIPTAAAFLKKHLKNYKSNAPIEGYMIEFARVHVKAALQEAADNAEWISVPPRMTNMDGVEVDKNSILSAYPESNIK